MIRADASAESSPASTEAAAEIWPGLRVRRAAQTRLVLIDDHLVVREGLAALLSIEPDLKVVGMAASVEEGIQIIRDVEPDLVLSDLTLPGCSGGTAVRSLCEVFPGIRILVLTVHDSLETVRAAFGAGATGYVCKDSLRDEMLYAIRRVATGGRATCFAVGDAIVRDWLERDRGGQRKVSTPLSAEDEEVLRLIARGVPTWRIAEELQRGVKVVEKYRASLMRRLGLKSTAAVTRFAVDMRLLSRQEVDRLLTMDGHSETGTGH